MRAFVLTRGYDCYGGHLTLTSAGDLIEYFLSDSDHGIALLEVTAHFRSGAASAASLEPLYREFHEELGRLPSIRWSPKPGRLSLHYESSLGTAETILRAESVSCELLRRGVAELASVFEGLGPKLRAKRGLHIDRLIDGLRGLVARVPNEPAELESLCAANNARSEAEMASRPWHEQMEANGEVEWAAFHPDARAILDDPFFWSGDDDSSPHGNDTGADLLSAYKRWLRRKADEKPQALEWPSLPFDGGRIRWCGRRSAGPHSPL